MEPSTASRIRHVCRVCRKRRYEMSNENNVDNEEWRMLNVLIVIVGDYFDQKDLQD